MVLAGCSTGSKSASAPSNAASDATSISMWMWGDGFQKEQLDYAAKQLPSVVCKQVSIGGDMKQKLLSQFQAPQGLPNITGIKGEWIAFFKSEADKFADLRDFGADKYKDKYLDWKWQQGSTTDGKVIGFPIDIGPTVLYYRKDVFDSAGLESDPTKLAAQIRTWDEFFELGQELSATKKDTYLVRNANGLFGTLWAQTGKGFIDESRTFIGDQDHIKQSWDTATKAISMGVTSGRQSGDPDMTAMIKDGRLPADIGASWHMSDLQDDAPDSKGNWRVCQHPGTPTNNGGSFLTIPAGVDNGQQAFDYIRTLLDPTGQEINYRLKANFPSTPETYEMDSLKAPIDFLGGQVGSEEWGKAAQGIQPFYEDPMNSTILDEYYKQLELVEAKKVSADEGWKAAVDNAKKASQQNGIKVQ